jgi:hypothetical protein
MGQHKMFWLRLNLNKHLVVTQISCLGIEKVLQELFSMWSAPCPLLGNGSLNTFPQKQTRGTIGDIFLGNGTVNRLCQQYRLCFPRGQCKVVIEESSSETGSCGRRRMLIELVQRSTTELACENKT